MLLKREKGDKVHYAASVTPRGNVDKWTKDQNQACIIAPDLAEKVRWFHKGLANVGTLSWEPLPAETPEIEAAEQAQPERGETTEKATTRKHRRTRDDQE